MTTKKALFVVAPRGFTDHEYLQPRSVLEADGVQIATCSTSKGPCRGSSGSVVQAEVTIHDVQTEDYDVVIVVGGAGCREYLWDNVTLLSLLKDAQRRGKMVAAIGRARHCLANAGLYKGDYTFGPPVEVDGNVIAGRPPATTPGWSSKAFGKVVAEQLRSRG